MCQVPFAVIRLVNRLRIAQDAVLAQAAPEWGDNHEHFSVFRRQAVEVSSIISSGQRAQRGQVALLRGIWQRVDYTNDFLLALLNHQRFVVSPPPVRLEILANS